MGRHTKPSRTVLRLATTAGGMALVASALGGGTAFAQEPVDPGADALGGTTPAGGTTLVDPNAGLANLDATQSAIQPAQPDLTVQPLQVGGTLDPGAGPAGGPTADDAAVVTGQIGDVGSVSATVTPNLDQTVQSVTGTVGGQDVSGSVTVNPADGTVTGVGTNLGDVNLGVTGDIGAGDITGVTGSVETGASQIGVNGQFTDGNLTGGSVNFQTEF